MRPSFPEPQRMKLVDPSQTSPSFFIFGKYWVLSRCVYLTLSLPLMDNASPSLVKTRPFSVVTELWFGKAS